jgi:hypothetical protein
VLLRRASGWLVRAITNANPRAPDIALLAGAKANDYWTSAAGTILWTASPDYFRLKEVQSGRTNGGRTSRLHDGPFSLFIDDCLSLSLDYAITGRLRPIEADEYFHLLLRTFESIEAALALPVVVAAHPNGRDLENYASYFGGRTVYFGATAALTVDCELALTHYSTAVAFPVLLRKPIVLLNAQRLKHTYQGEAIENLASLLNCPVVVMDAQTTRETLNRMPLTVDEAAYERYEKNYITTVRSPDTHAFEPFVRSAAGAQPV